MRAILLVAGYLAMVLVGAALLAPWVWWGAQALDRLSPAFAGFADQPFHRYLNRCMILLALAGLWPLLSILGSRFRLVVQPTPWPRLRRQWLAGAGLGLLTVAAILLIAVLAGAREWHFDHTGRAWFRRLTGALAAGLVVGILEEALFRGGIFAALRRTNSFAWAALVSGGLYSITHYFARPDNPTEMHWHTGLPALGQALAGWADPLSLMPGLLNLTILGWIFAWLFERTGSVAGPAGLHASMVFGMKMYGFITQPQAGFAPKVWGSNRVSDGWMATMILLTLAAVSVWWFRRASPGRQLCDHDSDLRHSEPA